MFKIKICGITTPADAVAALNFGADAIGLNFYQRSLRSVTPDLAEKVIDAIPDGSFKVGVFVNCDSGELRGVADRLNLTHIQLHGDETTEVMADLASWPVIRTIRIDNFDAKFIEGEICRWIDAGAQAILLDAAKTGQYGGTGNQLPWNAVAELQCAVPVILAGGLNCDNVSQAISAAEPQAVDVASGVESFPGQKDHSKLRRFIAAARSAFETRQSD